MLSRHFLRSKVLQAVYAASLNEQYDVVLAEKNFGNTIRRFNDLGIMQLAVLLKFREVAEQIIDSSMQKFMPTEAERNPNRKLLNNRFLVAMNDNFELKVHLKNVPVSWFEFSDALRALFVSFRSTSLYTEYLDSESIDFEQEKQFVLQLFKYIMNDTALRSCICEHSMLWDDDFDQIAQYNYMMLKAIKEDQFDEGMSWMLMYDTREEKDVDDFDFARNLLIHTIRNRKENDELIKSHLHNWDFERVALMDVLIINMAICEFVEFPSIPERVTVDEYIELSKEFSTDKSKLFVNGILDRILLALRSAGKINKQGRGLLDLNICE